MALHLVPLVLAAATAGQAATAAAKVSPREVSVREEQLSIPTWTIGPPELHPVFPGPQGPIYPYTLNSDLGEKKEPRSYKAVYLENEYVQVLILPELGGRVHGAVDKTNGYKWLYWQPTIKPGLISMTGAWISGGIEWNFPHGHRPSGFMPVDYRMVRNRDGSATVWVGETEPVFSMRWLVGITLRPAESAVRCEYVFSNPTDLRHSFQFWATAATHANEWAQAQYPGELMTGHGKEEFWYWPVHHGVDLSWWKNVPNASSFFAWQSQDDWFGTYDHKAQGGLVHVADHASVPGKKLWTWGAGPSGRIWEDILTEGGGPYFEPQAGAFSDNQPDYHWLNPGEVKRAQDVWYPVRGIRGFRMATEDFALNAEVVRGKAFAGVYATSVRDGIAITLEDARSGQPLLAQTARIAPDRPFTAEVDARGDLTTFDLRLRVRDASGKLLAELVPARQHEVPIPAIAKPRPAPAELKSPDQLYEAGEWLDRFRRRAEALAYYEEALRRDPDDAKVHVELGDIALGETRYADALAHFDKALARDAEDARANYGRATALVALGRTAQAEPAYERAGHSPELLVAAERGQARLAFERGDARGALTHVLAAEGQGGELFADLPALRAAAHRLLGDQEPALAAAERALELDPMHFMAGREKCLALAALGQPADKWVAVWRGYMRDSVQNQIELAAAYVESGLLPDAEAVLADAAAHAPVAFDASPFSTQKASPMLDYLQGYLALRRDDPASARLWYVRGAEKPLAYVNPHRALEAVALEAAVREDVTDAHARHLLGNVLYALGRREEALASWRVAAQLAPDLALAWRNIGMAEHQLHGDERAAADAYRRALAANDTDPRVLLELDQTLERLRTPAAERVALLDSHYAVFERRDDLTLRWIDLKLRTGDEAALAAVRSMLLTRHFHTWEGLYGIHHAFVETHQRLGDLALARGDLKLALARYQQAFDYPKNMEVAPRTPDLKAHLNWSVANAYIVSGRRDEALPALTAVLSEKYSQPHLGSYYQALALRAIAKPVEAARVLRQLEERARGMIATGAADARAGKDAAVGEYLLSLVLTANGDTKGAGAARARAEQRDAQVARTALTAAQVEFAGAHQ